MRLRDFMQSPVFHCTPTDSLATAARQMELHNVGSLVVDDADERIVGILTDRDLALSLGRGKGASTSVEEVMSRDVVTVSHEASLDDAAGAMDSRGVRRLPVVDEAGRAIGIICLDDLYNYLSQEAITLVGAVRAQGAPRA